MLAVVLFAIAVSVDGFLVGVAQGMRGIKVPVATLIVINIVSAVVVFLSLGSGKYVAGRLSPQVAKFIGSGILIALGALMLKPLSGLERRNLESCESSGNWATKDDAKDVRRIMETSPNIGKSMGRSIGGIMGRITKVNTVSNKTAASKIARTLMMILKFLSEPATADLDASGTLTPDEGFLLGIALAIDALGVGFGAGMAGISSRLTPVVAGVTQGMFVSLGLVLGRRMRDVVPSHILERAPGGILILLGAMRLK